MTRDSCAFCDEERDEAAIADDLTMFEDAETIAPSCTACYEREQELIIHAIAYWNGANDDDDLHH